MSEMTHLRLEKELKEQIKEFVEMGLFSNITEFVRDAIRRNIDEYNKRIVITRLRKNMGSLKGKIKPLTKEERIKLAEEYAKENALEILRKFIGSDIIKQ
jgi:Arc/MetJ-type ribon-helix-helix transcriptional regulator